MGERILVIDDDQHTIWVISTLLRNRGFEVFEAQSPEDGLRAAYQHHPDLVLLDVMMPDMSGWEVCERLRDMTNVPIIFLTARNSIKDVVRGLELGADDYVVKPFDNNELVARVKAHLRRRPDESNPDLLSLDDGQVLVNLASREVTVRGESVRLTPKEFDLLRALATNPGRVLNRDELVAQAWGPDYGDQSGSLKLYIHYLRKKIEDDPDNPRYILTMHGVGYRFADNATPNGN